MSSAYPYGQTHSPMIPSHERRMLEMIPKIHEGSVINAAFDQAQWEEQRHSNSTLCPNQLPVWARGGGTASGPIYPPRSMYPKVDKNMVRISGEPENLAGMERPFLETSPAAEEKRDQTYNLASSLPGLQPIHAGPARPSPDTGSHAMVANSSQIAQRENSMRRAVERSAMAEAQRRDTGGQPARARQLGAAAAAAATPTATLASADDTIKRKPSDDTVPGDVYTCDVNSSNFSPTKIPNCIVDSWSGLFKDFGNFKNVEGNGTLAKVKTVLVKKNRYVYFLMTFAIALLLWYLITSVMGGGGSRTGAGGGMPSEEQLFEQSLLQQQQQPSLQQLQAGGRDGFGPAYPPRPQPAAPSLYDRGFSNGQRY
jgi:hypothetical protein